jgi:23S rRNA (guanosine2251-2'-O)-methyltransferase
MRPNHPAAKRAKPQQQQRRPARKTDDTEVVLGRNPVLECLRARVPATALFVALGAEADERLTESVRLAADSGISILEVPRHDLDRIAANGLHQGIALQVPPYQYAHPDDLLAVVKKDSTPALLVALDNISDPRNLGAIVRSVAAFGGHGVLIPQRRSASVTAVAWRTSAGAAARVPVSRAPNLLTPKGTPPSTSLKAPARSCWWSVRRVRDCRGSCARTATPWCPSRWRGRRSR